MAFFNASEGDFDPDNCKSSVWRWDDFGVEPVDVWVAIGKDGRVEKLRAVGDDAAVSKDLSNVLKQWRFKPFVMDGQDVAVVADST